jgi:hypothetical protein
MLSRLPTAGAEEAHEGPSGSRRPRAVSRSRRRGVAWRGQRVADFGLALMSRRFPPPWTVEETDACFIVRDANGQALAYAYFARKLS